MSVGLNNANAVSFNGGNKQNSNYTLLGAAAGAGYGGFKLYKGHKDGTLDKATEMTFKILNSQEVSPKMIKSSINLGLGLHVAKYTAIGLGIGAILDFIANRTGNN